MKKRFTSSANFLPLLLLAGLIFLAFGGLGYYFWLERQPTENPYDPIIARVANEEGVDPFLIRAVVWRESKFNPHPLVDAQEPGRGLMQVTPEVGEMWAKARKITNFQDDDLYDPETNLRAGTWYLARALRRWNQTDDPVPFALAEYNAGRTNVLRWVDPNDKFSHAAFLDRITYPTTRKYVDVIMRQHDLYRQTLAQNRWYKDYVLKNTPVDGNATTLP